ncbi:MAG TPA: hypothetical protein PKL92_07845 [Aquaticitalea sp.]|nr:hypothetical protein [Aquaticitalea sp.]
MKNLIRIFSIILVFSLVSCSDEYKKSTKNIPSGVLAVLKDGKISLANDEQNIISVLTEEFFTAEAVQFTSAKGLELDGVYYIRMKNEEGLTATTLLVADDNGFLKPGGITCVTEACADNEGCVPNPNGTSCTKCWYDDGIHQDPQKGDCKKITTAPFAP